MNYRDKIRFMRSLECAIAGPGQALANTDERSQRDGALLAKMGAGETERPFFPQAPGRHWTASSYALLGKCTYASVALESC
jgi:hypothetical protein